MTGTAIAPQHVPAAPRQRLGVDTGGTFTDFVCYDGERLHVHKCLSTPDAPEHAVLAGLEAFGVARAGLQVVHGSTVATNAVLEGRGARTAFVSNRGFADLLAIGRQARPALYELRPQRGPAPVPPQLCLETGGRLGGDGTVVEDLTGADRRALRADLRRLAPEAVAVCLLFAFRDARFERAIEALVPPGVFVSRSSAVLPEYREYERAVATWLNARVGPLMARYLARLEAALAPARVAVMQSSGLTCDAAQAGRRAVHLLLSGPAGGLAGARATAAAAGLKQLLTFDMGGTSTDVALVDGEPRLTSDGRIGPWPVAVPMADIHTIGAGGGSVATVDAGGALQVGPRSAGARPGPACYGLGGREATVTDAHVVLGRLPRHLRLAGHLTLDAAAAHAALARLAGALGLDSAEAAAAGVLRVANEHMAQALRAVTVRRGLDPRRFVLACFGGAGGLHVCELAAELGIRQALVPAHPGVLSALGMVVAAPGRQLSRTVGRPLAALDDAALASVFAELAARGEAELAAEGIDAGRIERRPSLDLCYRGQSAPLNVPFAGLAEAGAAFHAEHERRYGHRLDLPVEVINVRLGLRAPAAGLPMTVAAAAKPAGTARVRVHGLRVPVPVHERAALGGGRALAGPGIVVEPGATVWLAPGWRARVDRAGNLLLNSAPG